MKLFGEFLIEKNLVNVEAVVDALIEQLKSIPPVSLIVRQEKLLNPEDILKALKHEALNSVSFVAAAKALGLWTPAIDEVVMKQLKGSRTPIGQLLVKQGVLDAQKLPGLLKEFLHSGDPKPTA